jgi:hypothetical protein
VAANVDRKLSRTVFRVELEWCEEISGTSMILDILGLPLWILANILKLLDCRFGSKRVPHD